MKFIKTVQFLAGILLAGAAPAVAEEGMWTFDNVPVTRINKTYGTHIDKPWLNRLQAAIARINSGCTGTILSSEGLMLTNHHCVFECLRAVSRPDEDHIAEGFIIRSREDEEACPGMAAEVLLDVSDHTADVNRVTRGLKGDAFLKAQNARFAEIEAAGCGDDPAVRCQMVTLYQGGQYKLYKYRRYNDLRLVFAPEFQSAYFGGDPDNYNFPRYGFDVAFMRLYENDAPAATPQHLDWAPVEPKPSEPVIVAGNPGWTQRLLTVSQLETQRDIINPPSLAMKSELRGRLIAYSRINDDTKRVSSDALFGVENGFKSLAGQDLALRNPRIMAAKRKEEAALKASMKGRFKTEIGNPWAEIAAAQKASAELYLPYHFLEQAPNNSTLFAIARKLVRHAAEMEKPSAERLPEFADPRLPTLRRDLLSPWPIEKPLEKLYLEFRLSKAREYLTNDAAETKLLLGDESPESLAERLVDGTRLDDTEFRTQLWEGGMAAIAASDDPMIEYAIKLDPAARALRQAYDERVNSPVRIASEKIAKVRFRYYGTSTYPDATYSPRLTFGKVDGWTWRGKTIEPVTRISGLYARATGHDPYVLSWRFEGAKDKLDGNTVLNFTTTTDIVGGNSGSPVVNAEGAVIGTIFDGNIHSLGGNFAYDPQLNRSVSVSAAAISEVLGKVYGLQALTEELERR
ncbi:MULTISPECIES: S46 family peptidase [Asticcacaulis]|uniref:S46 family peptidase n=1 Tax=Asticcacaulis TaxID=76890 RepID=UPI001FD9CC4B|nr:MULTISPECIES: S46 family peptidase [Asticcacaulis]MBP2158140.1 hypothetical protein [Asticcacaulis solisilvae]MDR6799185.1 hypothetical protein [Asticcacaulis sp. BE141]